MIFRLILIFAIFLTTINANPYEDILTNITNQLNNVKTDNKLGFIERQLKVFILKQTVKRIHDEIESNRAEQKNKANEEQTKLRSSIYNRFLASRMGSSSFDQDFHTIRY